MTSLFGFTPGQPPEWDLERFLRGDEVETAVITLERNRRTFAWKCADLDAEGLALRLGASSVTLGGLLKHLAWVEELYFQDKLGRDMMAPFAQLELEKDWDDWAWSTAAADTPDALQALWVATVHRSRDVLAEALSRGGLEQTTTPDGMSLRRLVVDLIEEYARHTGHADLLREQVDGVTGEGPPQDFLVP